MFRLGLASSRRNDAADLPRPGPGDLPLGTQRSALAAEDPAVRRALGASGLRAFNPGRQRQRPLHDPGALGQGRIVALEPRVRRPCRPPQAGPGDVRRRLDLGARAKKGFCGPRPAHRSGEEELSDPPNALLPADRLRAISLRRGNAPGRLDYRQGGRQSDHQDGLQPRRRRNTRQRADLHVPEALYLLADAPRLLGPGPGAAQRHATAGRTGVRAGKRTGQRAGNVLAGRQG